MTHHSERTHATRLLSYLLGGLVVATGWAAQDGEGTAQARYGDRPSVPVDVLPTPFVRSAPLGVEELAAGFTAGDEEVALGRRLFFDPVLSLDRTVACASCHRPEYAFADNRRFSPGLGGRETTRNSPSLLNKALSRDVLWDGRAATLEEQALIPIDHPDEMGLGVDRALERLAGDAEYAAQFREAYGRSVDAAALGSAIASFVRGLTAGDSPVDKFRNGDVAALTAPEEAGLWIYEGKGRCWRCHNGPNFSDESFHNTGVGTSDGTPEEARFAITGDAGDHGLFRTPGLRMLTQTAPYMHDGSLATLEEVVEFYRRGGNPNSHLSDRIAPVALTDAEASNLVAFLKALSR